MARAKEWALRCHLELNDHQAAAFTTLTYNDAALPVTLQQRHLQLWLKKLRKAAGPERPLRFFASGEYGEQNARPHYHAILYGMAADTEGRDAVDTAWGMGHTYTTDVTPARIAYVAGYTSKKIGFKLNTREQVDPTTGEVYTWQPPFIAMSRNPGIGHTAKREWPMSWRLYAIHNGHRMPVPRYLHQAWEDIATEEQKEQLRYEKDQLARQRITTTQQLEGQEQVQIAQQRLKAERRNI